jgi:hypothetical protein
MEPNLQALKSVQDILSCRNKWTEWKRRGREEGGGTR